MAWKSQYVKMDKWQIHCHRRQWWNNGGAMVDKGNVMVYNIEV